MPQASRVLLCCRDAARATALSDALTRNGFEVAVDTGPLAEQACEVIVADHNDLSGLPRKLQAAQTRGLVGLIQMGGAPGADVMLPADGTLREVVLASKLLTEIVRLRRDRLRARGTRRHWQRLAHQDPLTQLPNRRHWDQELTRRIAEAGRVPIGLALFDVDHFKQLNLQLGLPGGDRVLAAVGRSMAESIRTEDLVARLGGDEFGLLLCVAESAHLPTIVERVRQLAGEAASREVDGPVTLSAGLAIGCEQRPENLFAAADRSLREAKSAGRNRTCQDAGATS